MVIRVTENTLFSTRTGNLLIFNPNGGNSLTIKVTQLGKSNNDGGDKNDNTSHKLLTPTGVKVTNIGTSDKPVVQISWNNVPNATIYRVIKTYPQYGGYDISGHQVSTEVLVDTKNESVVDCDVKTDTAYEYSVMAAGTGYESSNWSTIIRINL